MRVLLIAAVLSALRVTTPLSAQSGGSSLEACRVENENLKHETERLKAEIERLNSAVLILSKQLGGASAAPVAALATPTPRQGNARLKVVITTKFNTGQGCSISIDDHQAGRIDYPTIEGRGTVMEYSSGFLEVPPGDHRVTVACSQVDGKKSSSVYTDQPFSPGEEYVFHTKINIWSKVLQQVSFGTK